MDDWWAELDGEVLGWLAALSPIAPAEIGLRLGISERAATSLLAMLAVQGKVRICLVEAVSDPQKATA